MATDHHPPRYRPPALETVCPGHRNHRRHRGGHRGVSLDGDGSECLLGKTAAAPADLACGWFRWFRTLRSLGSSGSLRPLYIMVESGKIDVYD